MQNTGRQCEDVFWEFYGREDQLELAAEGARDRLAGDGGGEETVTEVDTGHRLVEKPVRRGQRDFSRAVRDRYGGTCVLCEVDRRELLHAGHVLAWRENEAARGDPDNGILLCATHHRAFDTGIFTLDASYTLVVRPDFETESAYLRETIVDRDGESIGFPADPPSSVYVRAHNEHEVSWWEGESAQEEPVRD